MKTSTIDPRCELRIRLCRKLGGTGYNWVGPVKWGIIVDAVFIKVNSLTPEQIMELLNDPAKFDVLAIAIKLSL